MREQIYIEGLGYRHPIDEGEQIIWWLEKYTATLHKGHATKFLLNLLESYEKPLMILQAFELLAYLRGVVSEKQRNAREQYRIKTKQNAILEMKKVDWLDQYKARRELIGQIRLN